MSHSFTEEQLKFAGSYENRFNLVAGRGCGCYACCRTFAYEEISQWLRWDFNTNSGLCPYCRVNAVIGESDRYPLTQEFLEALEAQQFDLRTEEKWLQAIDPALLLRYLETRLSDRKMQLFACASLRLFWDRLIDERSKQHIEKSEAFADGLMNREDYEEYCFKRPKDTGSEQDDPTAKELRKRKLYELDGMRIVLNPIPFYSATNVIEKLSYIECPYLPEEIHPIQADLLRDVFGSPFHRPKLNPDWLTWDSGTVISLADRIYSERAFDLMPILADALQEAGCDDERILSHCRDEKVHARGCWVVDLLLQKE